MSFLQENRKLVALLIACYLLFILLTIPATQTLGRASLPAGFQLQHLSGTLWNGSAQQVNSPQLSAGPIEWSYQWWKLFLGSISFKLSSDSPEIQGEFEAGKTLWGNWGLNNIDLAIPVEILTPLVQKKIPVQLDISGKLNMNLEHIRMNEKAIDTDGKIAIRNLAVTSPANLVLGNFQLTLMHDDTGLQVAISEEKGNPVRIQAALNLAPEGAYQVDGLIAVQDESAADLNQYLKMLGSPDASGNTLISYQGQL